MTITYGKRLAAMVLTGHELGFNVSCVDDAKNVLQGVNVHPMTSKVIEDAAYTVFKLVQKDQSLMGKANQIGARFLKN